MKNLKTKENTHTCSITGMQFKGNGHNAYPFDGRCCDYANKKYVIPARELGVTPDLIKNCGMDVIKKGIEMMNRMKY